MFVTVAANGYNYPGELLLEKINKTTKTKWLITPARNSV